MLRFLFVGDSMTIGSAGEYTWRYRMWQHLCASHGGPFRIVGPREALYDKAAEAPLSYDYADPDFPRRHLAGWGEGWLHLAPQIREAVSATKADVILASLGLIDLGFYTDPEQTAANARHFITEARAANPEVAIVILPVIPNIRAEQDEPFATAVARFNELLAKTIADLDTDTSPLLLATIPPTYDIHYDTYDGTHPAPSGEHKLAAAFADAMHQAWEMGAPYPEAPAYR
ncbi:GDSL-type esterase/lipase family protein [Streptomyces apocyni]|uniref:GDSL-type esterase/lipase family protein n=1 Tax=Streptomyces apocyni TaxID=2654677 RepID=UPI0012EA7D30|nr:GDSL-type esterase/lipase family protein [Streptomyces apocyni]